MGECSGMRCHRSTCNRVCQLDTQSKWGAQTSPKEPCCSNHAAYPSIVEEICFDSRSRESMHAKTSAWTHTLEQANLQKSMDAIMGACIQVVSWGAHLRDGANDADVVRLVVQPEDGRDGNGEDGHCQRPNGAHPAKAPAHFASSASSAQARFCIFPVVKVQGGLAVHIGLMFDLTISPNFCERHGLLQSI